MMPKVMGGLRPESGRRMGNLKLQIHDEVEPSESLSKNRAQASRPISLETLPTK